MKESSKKSSDLRRHHNTDILRRMRNGETLTSFDSRASWFPPRPIIKKDANEMERLYQNAPPRRPALHATSSDGLAVVTLEPAYREAPLGEAS